MLPRPEVRANKTYAEVRLTNRMATRNPATGVPFSEKEWHALRREDAEISNMLPEAGLQHANYLLVEIDLSPNRGMRR